MTLLGPTHPIVVPRPPFSLRTASLLRITRSCSTTHFVSFPYGMI
jgi:hypothetical protein